MNDVLDAITKALNSQNYYGALFLSLALPSICGALESSDGEDRKERYVAWYDRYITDLFLSGEDCYYLRCGLFHQGRVSHPRATYSRIIFAIPTSTGNFFHNNILNDALQLDVVAFCNRLISGVKTWENTTEHDKNVQSNLTRIVRLYPNGLSPYIVGTPVIS